MTLDSYCYQIYAWFEFHFYQPTLQVGVQYVYFRSLISLLSVDTFILAVIIEFLEYIELYSDARRDTSWEATVCDLTKLTVQLR